MVRAEEVQIRRWGRRYVMDINTGRLYRYATVYWRYNIIAHGIVPAPRGQEIEGGPEVSVTIWSADVSYSTTAERMDQVMRTAWDEGIFDDLVLRSLTAVAVNTLTEFDFPEVQMEALADQLASYNTRTEELYLSAEAAMDEPVELEVILATCYEATRPSRNIYIEIHAVTGGSVEVILNTIKVDTRRRYPPTDWSITEEVVVPEVVAGRRPHAGLHVWMVSDGIDRFLKRLERYMEQWEQEAARIMQLNATIEERVYNALNTSPYLRDDTPLAQGLKEAVEEALAREGPGLEELIDGPIYKTFIGVHRREPAYRIAPKWVAEVYTLDHPPEGCPETYGWHRAPTRGRASQTPPSGTTDGSAPYTPIVADIDLPYESHHEEVERRVRQVLDMFHLSAHRIYVKRSQNGRIHVEVLVRENLTRDEVILIQSLMGDDPRRVAMNVLRARVVRLPSWNPVSDYVVDGPIGPIRDAIRDAHMRRNGKHDG